MGRLLGETFAAPGGKNHHPPVSPETGRRQRASPAPAVFRICTIFSLSQVAGKQLAWPTFDYFTQSTLELER
jgi:hypothetical protein